MYWYSKSGHTIQLLLTKLKTETKCVDVHTTLHENSVHIDKQSRHFVFPPSFSCPDTFFIYLQLHTNQSHSKDKNLAWTCGNFVQSTWLKLCVLKVCQVLAWGDDSPRQWQWSTWCSNISNTSLSGIKSVSILLAILASHSFGGRKLLL